MRLSEDKTVLLTVENDDLDNGFFIIPAEVISIGENAFRDCTGLTQLSFPAGLVSIGENAFWDCTGLTQLSFPAGLVSIGKNAFWNCTGLTQLTLPEGLTSIGGYAFVDCTGLTQLTLPVGLISIEIGAFAICTRLTQVSFPAGLTSIGRAAFASCIGLTQLTLPEGLTSIGEGVFIGCRGLTQLTLPEGLTSIGEDVFNGCIALESIVINTSSNEELEKIKRILPEEHRGKVIKNPVYDEALALQKEYYNKMHYSPRLSGLNDDFNFFNDSMNADVLVNIAGFDAGGYEAFKKAIAQYTFPTNKAALDEYKKELAGFVRSNNQNTARDIKLLSCVGELQKYLDFINQQKEMKEEMYPLFFSENPAISLEVTEKIEAILKAINWLKGETGLTFSPEEKTILSQGVVGKILEQFSSELPSLPFQASTP